VTWNSCQGDGKLWRFRSTDVTFRRTVFVDAKIIIDGDNYATAGMGASYSGKILLDPTSHPKKFDVNFSDGPHAGKASFLYARSGSVDFLHQLCRI
jgi:hypothetical protein